MALSSHLPAFAINSLEESRAVPTLASRRRGESENVDHEVISNRPMNEKRPAVWQAIHSINPKSGTKLLGSDDLNLIVDRGNAIDLTSDRGSPVGGFLTRRRPA
jgi:hypothetical protein